MAEGAPLQGLDEAVGSVLGDQAAAIRNNLAISLPGNPDQAAQYQHLAKFVGVPVESVHAFPDEVKTQASLQRFDADGAVRDYPHLARFLTDLPSVQKAHDDLPQLAAVEKAAQPRPPEPPPPAVAAQSTDFESRVTRGLLGLSKWLSKDVPAMPKAALQGVGGQFNTLAQGVNTVLGALPAAYDMAVGGTAASDWWFSHMVDRVIADADAFRPGDSFSEKAAHAVGSLVGMLSQITLSGTGAPGLAPAVPAEVSAGKILSSATEHAVKSMALPAIDDAVNTGRRVYLATGGDALAASNAATAQWAATTGMGLVPLSAAGRTGARLATGAVSGMVAGEASREGMNAVLPDQMAAPFDWESLFLSGVTGALMGGVMGPRAAPDFNAAIRKTYTDAAQADKAMQDAAQLGALSQIASASKLRERDPEAFRQFVENVTEDGNLKSVYVDAAKLGEVLNQSGIKPEDFAAQLPNVARQMHEAVQTEGMVEIPVADYATKIAGGPLDSVLLPELRTAPDGKTYSEAQAFYQTQVDTLKAQAEKIIADRAVNEAAQAQNDALRARILETISAGSRFRPEVNDTYATLQTAYTLQRAALIGMDPIEFHEQYGVKVVSGQIGDGSLNQAGLGAFSPETNTIALLKGANLSTFLHESGHYFLNTDAKLAALPEAPESLRRDMNTVLDWLGVKGTQDSTAIDRWHRMSLDEQRQYHEKYARGFEAYLFEGKAPNLEMQGVFSRLRSWMLAVYKSLTALNVQLTPEVRGVFDRMLSSEQAIRDAEAARGMLPIFTAPGDAMTAEAFARYQQLGAEATVSALDDLQSRSLRDMKWLSNAKAGALRDLQAQANSARAAVREQVSREVSQQPVYRAEAFLRRGEVIGEDGAVAREESLHKLDIDRVKEMAQTVVGIDPEAVKALGTGKHGMLGKIGLDPDFAAERLGFINGEDLVRSLLAMEKRADVVNRMTDQRMLEQHGELVGPAAIERAAEAAIHNEARARFIATELGALARATGPAKRLAKAAREAANAAISARRVMDIRPLQYTIAEGRSGKAAMDALKRGDVAEAAQHKRAQLLNNALARAARYALEDVRKGVDFLSRFGREGIRGKVDHDYMAQIDAILDRYDIRRSVTNKEVSRRQSLAEWVAQQEERGLSPSVPDYLLQESARTHYKAMSVEEFSGLVDTVRQIEHLGKLKNELLVARETRTYKAARDQIVDSISKHSVGRTADTRTPVSVSGRIAQGIKGFFAAHIKAATIARILDGGKDGGPMWEHFIRTANDRADTETVMRHEATEKLTKLLKPVMALGKMEGKGQLFDSIGMALNREQRIAIALNVGNEGNLQRLLGGEGWTRAQIEPVLQSLTAAEWRAVQSVWDLFESYRPLIAAKELRVYGIEPKWVEPTPFTVTSKDGQPVSLRGGYYPIKYDTSASERAERNADAETAKDQMRAGYTSATTRRSFTKARVDEVRDRPLLYSLSGLYGGLNEVIHDLAWHEWLIDTNRFMRSQSIDNAIRSAYGPEYKRELKNWVADIARGDAPATHAMERAVGVLRHGISVAGLGFNVMSAAIQPLGYTQSIVRIGPKYAAVGLGKMLSSPLSLSREINEKSDFMRERGRTRFRELNELRNQVQGKTAIKQAIEQHAYSLMLIMQRAVDLPTWWGGYEKAIAQGNAEARAIDLADQAVKDSQGSGLHMDLSGVERGGPFVKMFTTFYSFMNTAFNLGVERTMASRTPSQRARLAADYLLLYVLPPVLGLALKNALTPGESGLDDEEKLAKRLAKEQLSFALGLMVGVREFSSAADIVSGKPNDYAGPVGLRVVGDAIKTAQQAHQGEFDDAFRKALINLAGDMFALPSAQINRSITGIGALQEGKTENPAAVVFGFQSPH